MPSMHQLTQQCLNFIWHLLPCLCSAHCLAKLKAHLVSILWITQELYVDYAKASWLKLVFRIENADAKCRPLSFSWASVNVTCWRAWHKMSEQGSGGMKTGRERKIPSEEHWQTWQKGKISHVGVHWGTGRFMNKHILWESDITIWNTRQCCSWLQAFAAWSHFALLTFPLFFSTCQSS